MIFWLAFFAFAAFDTLEFAVEVDNVVRHIRFSAKEDVEVVATSFVRRFNLTEGLDCTRGDQHCVVHRLASRLREQVNAAASFLPESPHADDVQVSRWGHFALVQGGAHGDFMVEDGDNYVGAKLRRGRGLYEEPTLQLLLAALEQGDTVLDVGANVGAFTVPMARAVGHKGRVHAFEAQPHLANLLAANVALNIRNGVDPHSVVSHPIPVAARSGDRVSLPLMRYDRAANYAEVRLSPLQGVSAAASSNVGGGATDDLDREHIILDSLALDDLPQLHSARDSRCPALLKVDVETMEMEVLRGADALLRRCVARLVLYLETGGAHGAVATLAAHCRARGYTRVFHHEFDDHFYEHSDLSAVQPTLVMAKSINMLCLSNEVLQTRAALRTALAAHMKRGWLRELHGST